uniref:G protein-coupled receptor n=1 Tax=Haemonchus contortus TaxID=6289 RepID=A0A7I4Z104_HAECO
MSELMNCTRCEICAAAANIYSSLSFVHLSLLFRLIFEPIAVLGVALLTIAVYQTRALHFNARVLLICMTSSVLLCNTGVLLETIYKLYISFVLPEDLRCEYQVFRPQYFYVLRAMEVVGGLGLSMSTLSLAAERTLATITYKTYEKHDRKWIGVLLMTVQIILCVGSAILFRPPMQYYPIVTHEMRNSKESRIFGSILFSTNILSFILFTVLYVINRRRKRILGDSQLRVLSTGFQLRENIATTRLMTPVMFVVALLMVSAQWISYFHTPDLDEQTVVTSKVLEEVVNYAPYCEFQGSLNTVLTMMLIVLLPLFHVHIKRSFLRISHLRRCFTEESTSADAVTNDKARDIYFEKLNSQWGENAQHSRVNVSSSLASQK